MTRRPFTRSIRSGRVMVESDDPSWKAYPHTVLRFTQEGLTVDLRQPLSAPALDRLRRMERGTGLSVLTASNPRGRSVSDAENARRHRELAKRLRSIGCPVTPCDGTDPAGVHIEPGFAAAIDRDRAERLAVEFEQSAYFRFDGVAFWLMPALVRAEPVRLPTHPGNA